VSMFIDPIEAQIRASAELGAPVVELHTGAFANALDSARAAELTRLTQAARLAHELGLQVNAGHGLSYQNLALLLGEVPHLRELNIGHSIISRSLFVGLDRAVGEMLALMAPYAG
jgi:pyridoxine 5-phosphate synthase